jgi:putative transposase
MVTAIEYRPVPTGTLAVLAQRLGTVWASPSTWYHLVRTYGWRRPRLRVHPAKPKIGRRTTRANEMWHIDTTVIRLLDGSRAYLHAVDRRPPTTLTCGPVRLEGNACDEQCAPSSE